MAYNLPPPWSPKYAYPANTRVEALQRGTFTTRQQPRGSYDDPAVGTAGYAVPGYVTAQPYGQGAMVTKWMPRGTVVGQVPHWVQQPNFAILAQTKASGDGTGYEIGPPIESVHDDPFVTYGTRVADQVLAGLSRLPPPHRKPAMKALFDKIDPKLYTRVNATMTTAVRAGIPPKRALHSAIATEMRGGFLRELHTIGVTGHVKAGSQAGLGCWGCAAIGLGDTVRAQLSPVAIQQAAAQQSSAPITVNRVHNADGTTTTYCTQNGVKVACDPNQLVGAIAATTPRPVVANPMGAAGQTVAVGPFSFAIGGNTIDHRNVFTDPSQLTADQHTWLEGLIKKHLEQDALNGKYGILQIWFPDGIGKWASSGQTIDSDYKSPDGVHFAVNPIVGNIPDPTNPTGEPYGIFLFICGTNCDREPTLNPSGGPYLGLVAAPMSKASTTAWAGAVHAVGSVISSIGDAIGSIACDVLGHPAAATAAAAATGGAAGTGVKLAGALCQSNAPAPLVGPAPLIGAGTETLLIAGGGIALLYLLMRHRKGGAAAPARHTSRHSRRTTR